MMRGLLKISEPGNVAQTVNQIAEFICYKLKLKLYSVSDVNYINSQIQDIDAAFIIIGINSNKNIQRWLGCFRNVRIPYLFLKDNQSFEIKNIILPITNLVEDKEKGPFASFFARFFMSDITIYKPNDYGTRAIKNIESVVSLFNSFNLKYNIIKGKKNSSGIELEATIKENSGNGKLIIISASREYGLDDIIFGPKEKKIIMKTNFPILVINPRDDLYTLCE